MKYTFLALTVGCGLGLAQVESHSAGAVFAMTNGADKNEIVAYARSPTAPSNRGQTFATGGRGSGGTTDPLGSQGSLLLSADDSLLFAANAGSGDISVFRVNGAHLGLVERVASGGVAPNALAQSGNLLYVINSGASSSVSGFRIGPAGRLVPIPNSTRFLSTNITAASGLAFSPNGGVLLVIERLTNNIDIFSVQGDGTLIGRPAVASAVPGAFAVAFAPNGTALVVATGPGNVTNGSAISSYAVGAAGSLTAVSSNVPTNGAATCWHAVTPNGQFVYTSNSATSSISGYSIGATGSLTPVSGTVVATDPTGATNLDIAISADGKFLYALNAGSANVGIFSIQSNGTLTAVGTTSALPVTTGLNGLAAY